MIRGYTSIYKAVRTPADPTNLQQLSATLSLRFQPNQARAFLVVYFAINIVASHPPAWGVDDKLYVLWRQVCNAIMDASRLDPRIPVCDWIMWRGYEVFGHCNHGMLLG